MANEIDLLPCPFCGGEPEMFQIGQKTIKVKCTNCLVEKEQKVLKNPIEWLKGVMATWWNTRTSTEEAPIDPSRTGYNHIYDDENPDYIKGNEDGI